MIDLSKKIIELIDSSRERVMGYTNMNMVVTYFEIGKLLVEKLQFGEQRAAYGKQILKQVSSDLKTKFHKGFSVQNLERMRNFYLIYSKSSNDLRNSEVFEKSSFHLRISDDENKIIKILPLSWSHYLFLMRIENSLERNFYEIESYQNNWNLKDLERQFNSGLFERLALSKNKEQLLSLAHEGQKVNQPADLFKEPYVLEFLGLEEKIDYSETDLETAIINEIENFMLEIGKGFFFGGRQVRFTFDEDHYRIDLVFYNRLLQCFVLMDLKIGKLTHQDLGQMQMYVNYYDRFMKAENESSTIGIVLCKDKNQNLVEITLPENNQQIFASKYQTILPSKEKLKEILTHYETK
jgi:predicted nuclease of restriction endonuclease-like (RecB) superfamily